MKALLTIAALLAAGLAASCSDNAPATAKSCESFCVTVAAANDQAQIEERLKSECESMGRQGKPEIVEKSATQVSARCPQ
jgi:hypothetical protein